MSRNFISTDPGNIHRVEDENMNAGENSTNKPVEMVEHDVPVVSGSSSALQLSRFHFIIDKMEYKMRMAHSEVVMFQLSISVSLAMRTIRGM